MDSNKFEDLVIDKLIKIDSRLSSVDITLAKQHEQLAEHMRRTALAEESIKYVNRHVNMVEGGLKILGLISILIGIYKALD